MAMSSHMAPGATRHRGVVSAAPSTENRFPPQHAVSRPWPWPKLVSPPCHGTNRPREGCATACASRGQPQVPP